MRLPLIFLIFALTCLCSTAQDNIFHRDNSIITGNVLEINSKEIKYKTSDNINGPVYIVRKSKVARIRYENGKEEMFDSKTTDRRIFIDEDMARSCVYFEFYGSSIEGISLNFDYSFYRQENFGITGRLGVAPKIFDDHDFVSVPVTTSFIYGQKGSIEIGVGFTIVNYDEYDNSWGIYPRPKKNMTKILPTGIIGFRYQSKDKLFFRMVFTPIYFSEVDYNTYNDSTFPAKEKGIYNNLGIALGYAF
jgi:hypothetical protein